MFLELSLQIVIPVLILITFWVMPSLMPADLAFGVRIPPNHQEDALINQVRRDFRLGIVLIAVAVIIGSILLAQTSSSLLQSIGTVFAAIILASLDYLIAHYRLRIVKRREDWFAGQRQAIAVDTELHQEPIHLPVPWLILTIALVVAMFVIGALRYPVLSDRIPTHFNANGVPNGWMDKGIGTFFTPIMALVLTTLFIALTRFQPKTQARLDPANIDVSRTRYRKLQNTWIMSLVLISVLTNILMLIVSLVIWQLLPISTTLISIVVLLFPILIIGGVLAIYYRQLGSSTQRIGSQTAYLARDDDRYWKAGSFYFNRDDPSIFVKKRFGIGWTVNFGHPVGIAFMAILIVIIVALLVGSFAWTLFVK